MAAQQPTPGPKSEAELRAEKLTNRQIDQYWRRLERDRLTRRVHQEDLNLAEKVLRYWDVSSQYGVRIYDLCISNLFPPSL